MKIAIIGYSGSGKSTLARVMGEKLSIPVMHLDSVHFLPDWQERAREKEIEIVTDFMRQNSAWVIDGNYSKVCFDKRMEEADLIVMLLLGRMRCFFRAFGRYKKYRNQTRPDMAAGCNEKFDREFASWLLWHGRKKSTRERNKGIVKRYPEKVVVIRSQRQLTRFAQSLKDYIK